MSYSVIPAPAGTVIHEPLEAKPSRPPTRDDWVRHRPLITRLYGSEGKSLKEVIVTLARYGHKATPKMFKVRIKEWGLDKKNKERDMIAILRKKTQREAVGKQSSFRVRGQVVAMENVLQYFKRKKETPKVGSPEASTPSDISCWTPSPVHTPQPIDNGTRMDAFLPLASASNGRDSRVVVSEWTSAPPIVDDEHLCGRTYNFVFDPSKILYSPSSPQSLLVAERLFFSINAYFDGSFRIRPIAPGTLSLPDHTPDFETYCRNAAEFLRSGSTKKFRRELSKATNLVKDLLRAEHPRTLDCFLEVFLTFLRAGHPELASLLRRFIGNMAAIVIARKNPWGDICQLITELDAESLEQALAQSWQCTIDAFENSLGPFNQLTLDTHLQFIHRVYASIDLLEEERLLRELLAQYHHASDTPIVHTTGIMLNLMRNMIAQGHYTEGERLGQVILSRPQDDRGMKREIESIIALKFMAECQYQQDQPKEAERSLRADLEMVTRYGGMNHPLVVEIMIDLKKWLRGWGRLQEADELEAKIDMLVGRDESDELRVDG